MIINFELNINHLLFFLIFLSYFIRYYILSFTNFIENEKQSQKKFFNIYIYTISNLFSVFPFIIEKKRSKRKHKKIKQEDIFDKIKSFSSNINKTKTIDIELIYEKESPVNKGIIFIRTLMVAITDLSAQYFVFIFYIFVELKKIELDFILIFNILSKYLFSRLILQTYYYKHHHLSFMINLICLILISIIDIYNIHNNWNMNIIYFIFIKIFCTVCYSLEDVIGKKALIEDFLSPYSIIFFKGIFELILLIIGSIPFFFIKIDNNEYIFSSFIEKLNSIKKLFLIFLLMLFNFIYNCLIWIINDRFSPNDLAIAMIIEGITDKLDLLIFNFDEFKKNLYISIYKTIIYIILILGALVHNEIIILNFCGLNEYTRKNLDKKSDEDFKNANRKTTISSISLGDIQNVKDINDKIDGKNNLLEELPIFSPKNNDL